MDEDHFLSQAKGFAHFQVDERAVHDALRQEQNEHVRSFDSAPHPLLGEVLGSLVVPNGKSALLELQAQAVHLVTGSALAMA
jgi:hypothetical protein